MGWLGSRCYRHGAMERVTLWVEDSILWWKGELEVSATEHLRMCTPRWQCGVDLALSLSALCAYGHVLVAVHRLFFVCRRLEQPLGVDSTRIVHLLMGCVGCCQLGRVRAPQRPLLLFLFRL